MRNRIPGRASRLRWVEAIALVAVGHALTVGAGEPSGAPSASRSETAERVSSRPRPGAVEFAGHSYLLVDEVEGLSWDGAREQCREWGGTLAVVTSRPEAEFIAELCDGRYMFLGASDAEQEGQWRWVDGTAWSFTYWMDGQPNNYGDVEDYLATYDEGRWVDVEGRGSDFWMPTGFICEWDDEDD